MTDITKLVSANTKIVTEANKVTVVTEVKAGGVTNKTQTSLDSSGTISVKETVETKLPGSAGLTLGVSAKTGSNTLTGETSSSTDVSVSKTGELDLGVAKFNTKASINIVADATSKPAALDASIAIVKTDLNSGIKLELKASTGKSSEVKAEGTAFSIGATNLSVEPRENSPIIFSTTGAVSVAGTPLNKSILELSTQEYADAQTRLGNMIETVKLNQTPESVT